MDSLLEELRVSCEEIEFYQSLFVEEMLQKPGKTCAKVLQEHNASYLLDQIVAIAQHTLASSTEQQDRIKQEENRLLCGNSLDSFYAAVSKITAYHRSAGGRADEFEVKRELFDRFRETQRTALDSLFTGEECFGKFLDLNEHFARFINLKGAKGNSKFEQLDLISYLKTYDDVSSLSKDFKSHADYKKYLDDLQEYLERFIVKSLPLFNLQALKADLEKSWNETHPPGESRIWCERCAKYFSKQTVYDAHITGRRHQNSTSNTPEPLTDIQAAGQPFSTEQCEFFIESYGQILDGKRNDTISNLERKRAQTLREREESENEDDAEGEESHFDETNAEQEVKIYNPLKLPLDWDGKPIPYWLWKLHGLGTEFPCEICGGFIYMGRKAFDKHFQEWRHAYGMKCLGLANSKHFYGITAIKDALALNEKLKHSTRLTSFSSDTMEEYEDENGNVFSRRTFEDLRKQGLI